ncbi:MAG: AI-2E family transporter [Rhodospirillales bacterium]|jgi:predicted PurR-regulated permease PerM|nr:AI-2E family transporter [Rhodospirillales bacterium]
MTPTWRLGIGIAAVALLATLLSQLSEILLPFVAGMAVAYFLDPLADRLEKWGCSRTIATSLITAAFFVLAVAIVVLLFPLLQAQTTNFLARLPEYASRLREFAMPLLERLETDLTAAQMEELGEAARTYGAQAIGWIAELLKRLWSGGVALLQLLSLIVITPLVTFYLIRDWDRIVARIDALLPRKAAPTIRAQFREIDEILAGFVHGQASVCLILGILYAVGLTVVGLDFGLLIGLGTGLISFVPYFGMLVGLAVGLGMAFAQFHDLLSVGLVAAVFAAGQIIEGQFLTPKLVGERVRLHPAWVIFALLAGGALFGFTGVLLAIPVAAVIGVLVRFAIESYTQSRLYRGESDTES